MKKVLYSLAILVFGLSIAFAADPFDEFANNLTGVQETVQKNLDYFAQDLGILIGGGAFHQGKSLGFPGFDISVHVPAKKVNTENQIVKAANIDTILFPVLQAEIGLPSKIDIIARYMSYAGSGMVGVGARYGILKGSLPAFPSISVQAVYNMLNASAGANKFKATTASIAAVGSLNLPVINPYFGIGLDSTSVEPDALIAMPQSGMKGNASTVRAEAGINLSMIPFTYVQLGGTIVNGEIGYIIGIGVKF